MNDKYENYFFYWITTEKKVFFKVLFEEGSINKLLF